jgi:hypothetical protein
MINIVETPIVTLTTSPDDSMLPINKHLNKIDEMDEGLIEKQELIEIEVDELEKDMIK